MEVKEEPSRVEENEDCEALLKLKRTLSTLVNHAKDANPEKGEILGKSIIGLVVGTGTLDDFFKILRESLRIQTKPQILPYLRMYLPFLVKEVALCAKQNKMSPSEYVASNPTSVLDPDLITSSSDVFETNSNNSASKRKYIDFEEDFPPAKRPFLVPVERSQEEQWRNIHVMLNCILSMVEKTKAAICMLQDKEEPKNPTEVMAQTMRLTEDRVAQVKKKAEEAVAEVKRKAMLELQRAVSAAEAKAAQLVANEKAKLDRILSEAQLGSSAEAQNCCWNCGRRAEETCSGCNVAKYCGSFCQHKDWESHQGSCRKKK